MKLTRTRPGLDSFSGKSDEERSSFFPSLIERHETFVAYVYRGYWIDIGTPDKYMQVHRDN